MKPSVREVLATSHVGAVAVAVLLVWSLDNAFRALWIPLYNVGVFLVTAVAILGIPDFYSRLPNKYELVITGAYLYGAIVTFAAAWILARWVYGVGPLRCLGSYRTKLTRRTNV